MRNLTAFVAMLAIPAMAQDLPRPSPSAEVEQTIGLTKVTVAYSRPGVKERKVFGELVPYNELWRTGANKCTSVAFDGPVKINEKDVPAGKYCMFTIPGAEKWTVIFNSNADLSGTDGYKEEEDVLRFEVPAKKSAFKETFTIEFDEVKDDKARMDIVWENTRASFMVHADATDKALANIKEALAKEDADYGAYNRSARYLVDNGIMLEQAQEWATKSVSMEKKFWNVHTLALAQASNGQYKEAITTAEESMRLAQEADYAEYVKMNKEKMEEWRMKMGK